MYKYFYFIIFMACLSYSQTSHLKKIDSLYSLGEYHLAKKLNDDYLIINKETSINNKFNGLINNYRIFYRLRQNDSSNYYLLYLKDSLNALNHLNQAKLNNYLGTYFRKKKVLDSAVYFYNESVKYFETKNTPEDILFLTKNYQSLALLFKQTSDDAKYFYFLNKNLEATKKLNNKYRLTVAYNNLGAYFTSARNIQKARFNYLKALESVNRKDSKSYIAVNIAETYLYEEKKIDSCIYYIEQVDSLDLNKRAKASYFYIKSQLEKNNQNYSQETYFLKKAISNAKSSINNLESETLLEYYKLISESYVRQHNYKDAYIYHQKFKNINDTLRNTNVLKNIEDIQTKYQTAKKEKENLELKINLEQEQRQKKNLWLGAILTILIGSLFAYFINKNTKRKQLLAEKDKALQIQKVSTLLKEQELTSIDAMIAGQEKERQRIANDLHDDLGALMATIKLHLNALEKNNTKPITQVNTLINEAYSKIRGMAHRRNAGVMAQDGLLKALHKVAHTINQSKQLQVNIVAYGLENRLENSLELSIFRMIQELITNIIKHAQATEANIHLTQHEESLNIMVEDNGIGFNTQNISKKDGMGIHSIDKRIEHLNGTIDIESATQQGTTVIIDIPL